MNNFEEIQHHSILMDIARRVLLERGLLPDFSPQALKMLDKIIAPAGKTDDSIKDLRDLIWCSIDNDDSMDLDQLTVAEALPDGNVIIRVAVADVDVLVPKNSPIDDHAKQNTTSIYTAAEIFPMLPEKLSTDLTSLNPGEDRIAMIVEMIIAPDGTIKDSSIFRALVHNHAKLAYHAVGDWLEGHGEMPEAIGKVDGLEDNLRLQDVTAQKLKELRHEKGALNFQTIEVKPKFEGEELKDFELEKSNRATEIIEDFMIASNGVTARYLASKNFPSLRRVVRVPKNWDGIVELAREHGFHLPKLPDSKSLEKFLIKAKADDPLRFPDISLSVIKLMGAGEYVAERPGGETFGHFGLAVKDYSHSTAPNRRYPDVITQRLLKAALAGKPIPYSDYELSDLAMHCTQTEDAVKKAERQVEKSAAAILLESRVGERFDAIVTGASDKGVWVRILAPPVEGKLMSGYRNMQVGRQLKVELTSVDIDRGFINFDRV